MRPDPRRFVVLAAYQLSLLVGILLLPLALLTRKVGLPVPFHRVIGKLRAAYERTSA